MLKRTLFLGLALAALTFAQGKKGGSRGGGDMQDIPMMGGANRMDMISNMLKLDKEEKKQVKTIMDDAQKEAAPVREDMEKSRLALAEAVASGKQEEIGSAAKNYAAAETKMAGIEMNAFAKVYEALDKEQQAKSMALYGMMPGIFKGKNWTEAPSQ